VLKACEFVIVDSWKAKSAQEMLLVQAECHYMIAQVIIDNLNRENFEIALAEPVRI